ncbi:MAG: EpsG family protein [Cetobacterium sp.]
MTIYAVILIILNICSWIDIFKSSKYLKKIVYTCSSVILIGVATFRNEVGTDSKNYIDAFKYIGKITLNPTEVKFVYSDKGFIFLTSIIKEIFNSVEFYFFLISLTTILIIIYTLYKMTSYPLIGLLVYYIRFYFLRDLNQMRAGLAIAILMITFLSLNKKIKTIFIIFISSIIHKSCILWITVLALNKKLSNKIVILIITISIFFNYIIYRNVYFINSIIEKTGVPKAYISGEYGLISSKGFKNPILYYQLIILFVYMFLGKSLRSKFNNYDLLKNIYLISILFFLLFMPWSSLAGRTSTIFATVEIFIIPSFIYAFKRKIIINFLILIILNLMAYINIFLRLGNEYNYF